MHVNLTLEQTTSGLDLSYSLMDGTTVIQSYALSYATASLFSFDTLGVSASGAVGSYTIDNVNVVLQQAATSPIPEPSTYGAILGGVILAWGMILRRKLA